MEYLNIIEIRKRGIFPLIISLRERAMAKSSNCLKKSKSRVRGFTFIEVLLVVGILGMMTLIFLPDIRKSTEVRQIENEAREILTTMQRTKFQAVKTKLNHRVRFEYKDNTWFYEVEIEQKNGQWNVPPGYVRKIIPSNFTVDVQFPDQYVVFSPLGVIDNYDIQKNHISLQSTKLKRSGQPDQRVISVLAGGSVRYEKSVSE